MIDADMTVAVTGASGFLGRALVEALVARGARVHGLSRRDMPPTARVRWVRGDVSSAAALRELTAGASVVLHAASFVHRRPRNQRDLAEMQRTNVEGTERLVERCVEQGNTPLVFVSSTAVYGAARSPWDESTPCEPLTHYGRTKLDAERIVLARHSRAGVVRPTSIVGDRAPGSLRALDAMLRIGIVPVIDGGAARKSITHVSTVVRATIALAERALAGEGAGRVVVATDDEPCSVRDIALLRARKLGRRVRFSTVPRRPVSVATGWIDRALEAGGLSVPRATALLATLADDAVASNRLMRTWLGVVPSPTAREYLGGTRRSS